MLFILVYAHMLKGLFLSPMVILDKSVIFRGDYFTLHVFVAFLDIFYLEANELLGYYYYIKFNRDIPG